jgi:hypothetical protein
MTWRTELRGSKRSRLHVSISTSLVPKLKGFVRLLHSARHTVSRGQHPHTVGYDHERTHCSSGILKTRGCGFPGCGSGVTDPTSTCPNPTRIRFSTASASLSNPAANPIGLVKRRPQTVTASSGGSGRFSRGRRPQEAERTAKRCAVSGSRSRKKGAA